MHINKFCIIILNNYACDAKQTAEHDLGFNFFFFGKPILHQGFCHKERNVKRQGLRRNGLRAGSHGSKQSPARITLRAGQDVFHFVVNVTWRACVSVKVKDPLFTPWNVPLEKLRNCKFLSFWKSEFLKICYNIEKWMKFLKQSNFNFLLTSWEYYLWKAWIFEDDNNKQAYNNED